MYLSLSLLSNVMCLLCVFIMCLYGLIYVFNLCIVSQMSLFDICSLIFHTHMHLSAHGVVSFYCVLPNLVNFFLIFPISLLTFCWYAIIYYMFHLYINQFGAH